MRAHAAARGLGVLALDQGIQRAVFVQRLLRAAPGLHVGQVAPQVHRAAHVVLQHFQHRHQPRVGGGLGDGLMKAVVEVVRHVAARMGLLEAVQHLPHARQVGALAAQRGQMGAFGLHHQPQFQPVQDVAEVGRRGLRQRRRGARLRRHVAARAAHRLQQAFGPQPVQCLPHHRARDLEARGQRQLGRQPRARGQLAGHDGVEQAVIHPLGKALAPRGAGRCQACSVGGSARVQGVVGGVGSGHRGLG